MAPLGEAPGRVRSVGYPRRVPELPEVERYRKAAEAVLHRSITSVTSDDAWFLKGGTTSAALDQALVGHAFIAARRIGKVLLLDVDAGPTLGLRFGMTGTLVVDGAVAIDHLLYAPSGRNPSFDRGRRASRAAAPWWSAIRDGWAA